MAGRFRPVVLSSEIVIFEDSIPVKNVPRFPTEKEAWEYIDKELGDREEKNTDGKVGE